MKPTDIQLKLKYIAGLTIKIAIAFQKIIKYT